MIQNPLTSQLLIPVSVTLAALLGGSLVVLSVVTWLKGEKRATGNRGPEPPARGVLPHRGVLLQRWKVWAVIAPVFAVVALAGPLPVAALVATIAAIGAWEFARLTRLYQVHAWLLASAAAVVPFLALGAPGAVVPAVTAAALAATLLPLTVRSDPHPVRSAAFVLLGIGWIAWLPSHAVLLSKSGPDGPGLVLALGLGVALSDIGAYLAGKSLGRHKLAPRISPGKTLEGVLGNLGGAYLGFLLMVAVTGVQLPVAAALGAPALIALGCVWGDLAESALKREFEQKDAGRWLPGFGGLLDRVDSLLVATPLLFHFLVLTT